MTVRYHIGVDLGGTKIAAVLMEIDPTISLSSPGIDPEHLVRDRLRWPTEAWEGYDHILERVVSIVRALRGKVPEEEQEAVRIGIGLPGHISRQTGRVKNANTTCLNGRDLWGDVRRALERPVGFDNDANCLTLAEATWGAARGARMVFGVILGTGVGGGIAYRGEVWSGLQGIAGEWGHTVLDPRGPECYCGKRGCVETYLSGPALERALREKAGIRMSAREFNEQRSAGGLVGEGCAAGEAIEAVWQGYMDNFGRALSQVINTLDPDVVVIGGGMSRLKPLYTEGLERVRANVFNDELATRILPATLGDAAGVYGAALIGEGPAQ